SDLSPGFDGFVKSFLLKPALVRFSVGGAAPVPTSTTVTATVYIDLESGVFTGPVNPPHISVTLFVLPLTVPQVAAAFKNGLTYNEDDQEVFVVTDPVTSTFAPSAEDLLRLLTRLVTVLNTIVSFAKFLGAGWSDLMDAAS